MTQTWRDLLFAHWPVPPEALQPYMPAALVPDVHSGSAWIAVVPFRMTDIRPIGLPVIPVLSETLELNVRTYTTVGGVPGVYFFSLDASSKLAVRIARRFFHLPYFDAAMSCETSGNSFVYRSRRTGSELVCDVDYAPTGPIFHSAPGSLDYFLTERYSLYTTGRNAQLYRGRIRHPPWPLQPAEAHFFGNSVAAPLALALSGQPLLHFSRELRVLIDGMERC